MQDGWKIYAKRAVAGFFLLFSLYMALKVLYAWEAFRESEKEESALIDKRVALDAENAELRKEIRFSRTPEAVERDGKARLNKKLPGEKVVVIVLPTTTAPESLSSGFWKKILDFLALLFP